MYQTISKEILLSDLNYKREQFFIICSVCNAVHLIENYEPVYNFRKEDFKRFLINDVKLSSNDADFLIKLDCEFYIKYDKLKGFTTRFVRWSMEDFEAS